VLPRLFKIKYDSGLQDELLFLDLPQEKYVLPSGRMVLEYADAVHESVFRDLRVVRYGKLRVTFSPSFKVSNYFTLVSAFQSGCMLLAVWKLMKSVGSHGSSLLLFIMKVHVLSDSQKVMTIIVFVLTSKCCCGVFSSISLMWFHVLLWLYVVSPLRVRVTF
jgi:hypothetical protein